MDHSRRLALALHTRGLINIQYVIYESEIFVIEVSPRSSRTVPYISKVTGVPMVDLATRAMLGDKLADVGFQHGAVQNAAYVAVKVPIFSFEKLADVDILLDPEMKSTGRCSASAKRGKKASLQRPRCRGVQYEAARRLARHRAGSGQSGDDRCGAKVCRSRLHAVRHEGTAAVLRQAQMKVIEVGKLHETDGENILDLIEREDRLYPLHLVQR